MRDLEALAAILRLAHDDTNLDALIASVRSRPEFASRVVALADTQRYGMAGRMTRLERVITILGPRATGEIATVVTLRIACRDWPRRCELGMAAETIVRHLALPGMRGAFTVTVLGGLGVLACEAPHCSVSDPLDPSALACGAPGALASAAAALLADGTPAEALEALGVVAGEQAVLRAAFDRACKSALACF